ncbi:MAG TPA: GTPase [Phycisphaerales bacterium]|nr:GTPase [Phycisphaerales bacterium]
MRGGATIIACATGDGWSERALVRLSGPACEDVERLLLTRPPGARSPMAARFALTDGLPVPCLAWRGTAPRTYTGEETLELLLPGNPHLVRRAIARACRVPGVRPAEAGEFSARAYLNGTMSLEKAEGVSAMVAAESVEQLTAAAAVLSGAAGSYYRAWSEETATLLALVEAGIDFTDQEDVVAIAPRVLSERLERLRGAVRSTLGGAAGREAENGRARVALVGLPNAGKSTLFNALLGRTRAVASPIGGTTRDVLVEPLALSIAGRPTLEVDLMDLPGLDVGAQGIDALGQRAAAEALATAAVRLHCCDQGSFDELALSEGTRTVRVRTKADRPGWVEGAEVAVCALTGAGLDRLRRLILEAASASRGAVTGAVVARHALALGRALEALDRIDVEAPAELTAHHLRAALDAFGEVSGAVPPDEVIGRIFASFCIGK